MEMLSKFVLVSHIVAGFVALTLFWVQAYTRKGGANHRKVGKLYVTLMWVVVISAAVLCVLSVINGRIVIAIFLLFIALITAKPLWLGTAVLNAKKGEVRSYRVASVMFNAIIVAAGAAMVIYGSYLGGQGFAMLLMIFGGLGLLNAIDLWSSIRTFASSDINDWMKQHIAGMGTSGIAAHTAFLVFGANSFMPAAFTQSSWSFVPWLAPTVVGTVLIRVAVQKYSSEMGARTA